MPFNICVVLRHHSGFLNLSFSSSGTFDRMSYATHTEMPGGGGCQAWVVDDGSP